MPATPLQALPLAAVAADRQRDPGPAQAGGSGLQRLRNRLVQLGGGGLAARAVALSLLLVGLLQLALFGIAYSGIERTARLQLGNELVVGERVWQRLLENEAQRLRQAALMLAADAGMRSALASGDFTAAGAPLDSHGARAGATVAALLDPGLQVRVLQAGGGEAFADAGTRAERMQQLAAPLARGGGGGRIALFNGRPLQLAVVPVRAATTHWVVLGFPLGQAQAEAMHSLTGLHVALVAEPAGQPAQLVASSLGEAARAALQDPAPRLLVDGEEQATRTSMQEAGAGALRTMLMRPLKDATAPYRWVQGALAAVSLLSLALCAYASLRAARAITTPLRALQRASERLGRGEYAVPTRHIDRHDEIGDLARAMEEMRGSIAASQAEVRRLAYVDRLTGLPNRARFRDALLAATRRVGDGPGATAGAAVLMLNLDRFRQVNDVLGYAWGDRLLGTVARRLVAEFGRDGAVVARFGADEFALLLPGAGAEAARAVAARIQALFAQPLVLDDQAVDLGACIGIACWPEHAADADTLLARAEVALHAAKRRRDPAGGGERGGDGVATYDPALDAASVQTLSLMSALQRAVDAGELRLVLQPRVDLLTGGLQGAGALLRWQHPTRGLLLPGEFVPFAEQNGFGRRLTLWVFEQACSHWAALQSGGPVCLSVKLCTRDLLDAELPERFDTIAQRHRVPAGGLCLEVAESAIAHDAARAEAAFKAFNQRGYRLSIDDFGTGYSSLAQLKRLPVDELKIARHFVTTMRRNTDDAEVVRSTIELAHSLGLTVVANGVECEADQHWLVEIDCDEGQGGHIGDPLSPEDFKAWARAWAERHPLPAVSAMTDQAALAG